MKRVNLTSSLEISSARPSIKPDEEQWAEYDPSKDRPDLKVISS